MLEAMEAVVEERGRVKGASVAGGGRGTDSIIVWAFWKAVRRYVAASARVVGTEEKEVGESVWRAAWRAAMSVFDLLGGSDNNAVVA